MQNNPYVFGHSEPEIERLRRQAEMLRPITQRLLISAGVKKGIRVLDIGCGPSDVTMLAADLVGSTGRVVGIDRDEAVIDPARKRISELGFSLGTRLFTHLLAPRCTHDRWLRWRRSVGDVGASGRVSPLPDWQSVKEVEYGRS